MEKFIMAAGTALRISDTLKGGTTVVLMHGYLESLEIWGDFMKELAMHYRVLAIDIPGMGISQVRGEVHTMEFLADVLKGVLDKQGVERCFVVGHSMGGYVAGVCREIRFDVAGTRAVSFNTESRYRREAGEPPPGDRTGACG